MTFLTPDWPAPSNVRAAMSTRQGGVSVGPYASLNLGAGVSDDPAHVAENRRRLITALDLPSAPVWLKQVHGINIARLSPLPRGRGWREAPGEGVASEVHVGRHSHAAELDLSAKDCRPTLSGDLPEADASFATEPGVVCAVMAADCLPVLFCDDAGTVVAAAHAGWRGLSAGILEAAVRALPVNPEALMAWMGAAIGPESFEVGAEVREAFVSRDPQAAACFRELQGTAAKEPPSFPRRRESSSFKPQPLTETLDARLRGHDDRNDVRTQQNRKYMADLYGLARQRLAAAGVTRIYGGGRCTLREPEQFFSHRRDGRCGRMAALVWRR